MASIKTAFFVVVCLLSLESIAQQAQNLPTKPFTVCGKKVNLELALSEGERSIGLMYRKGLAPNRGMIFVYQNEEVMSFWMRNVSFDIDIGFFNAKGFLVHSTTMLGTSPLRVPSHLPTYSSLRAAKYAVEVEKGFYSKIAKGGLKLSECRLSPLP